MKISQILQSLQNAQKHFGKTDPELFFSATGLIKKASDLKQIVDVAPTMFLGREIMVISTMKIKTAEQYVCPECGSDTLPVVGATHRVCQNALCDFGTVYL